MKKFILITVLVILTIFLALHSVKKSTIKPLQNEVKEKSVAHETAMKTYRQSSDINQPEDEDIADRVRKVIDKTLTDNERMVLLYDLQQEKINRSEEEFLRKFLLNGDTTDSYAVRNDVIELLVRKSYDMQETAKTFYSILSESQDEVLREYTLQYVHELYSNYFKFLEESEYNEFTQLLYELLDEKNSTIAGAALFALNKISDDFKVDKLILFDHASQLLSNNSFSISSRVAATQLLYVSESKEHRKLLMQSALDEGENIMVRLASIKSIEKQGKIDDSFKSFLEGLIAGNADSRLQYVAQLTLKNTKKLGN